MLLTTSGRMSAHICKALIEPHSMILLFSHSSDTGFVRKSLHPAASAAPSLRVIIAEGKFHGVRIETTPTGCLITTFRVCGKAQGMTSVCGFEYR